MDNSAVINADGAEPDVDKCHICLSPFTEQTVASLSSCQHVFCLQCILEWSKTANTCPVDRISFNFIHPGGDVQKKIKVKTHRKEDDDDDDEEERSHAVICEECGRSDRRHRLLVCIHCDSGYHMDCLTPSLSTNPEGDWICADCVVTPHHTEGSVVEEYISDGELTDLLADMDEMPSTSSRLRPSTMNQPSSSTGRRHSQRIQSRASSSPPNPRPKTSWHVPKYLIRASKPAVATDEPLPHSDTSSASDNLNTKKRRKRAT
ncbi:PHD and RING finger domain-containing protein 1-like [Scomber scombrus]|uniref:PHD and RING finger domain-containing protein 1-like n=1 Tax=Scomber scombrus TaxID=13677 RepID=A0AAV1PWT2_SCOSC